MFIRLLSIKVIRNIARFHQNVKAWWVFFSVFTTRNKIWLMVNRRRKSFKSFDETFRNWSHPFWMRGCSWCSSMSRRFLSNSVIVSRLRCDCWPDAHPGISGTEAEGSFYYWIVFKINFQYWLTLQAASMVLHKAPLLGSQRNAWATNLSCAVWTMKAQFFTFFPMPRKLK